MNYNLKSTDKSKNQNFSDAWGNLKPLLTNEKAALFYALIAIIVNSGVNLLGPLVIAYTIDTYIIVGDFQGVLSLAVILVGIYIVGL